MANEIQKASPMNTAAELMKAGNMDTAKLKELLELQERWEANEARKAYHEAMAAFKADPPEIVKDKRVSYTTDKGTTEYDHASLANVCNTINKALSVHGLTAAWVTEQGEKGGVTVTCTITHIFGHREQTSLTAPPDPSGRKNPIQAIGSTVTYLQRYTLLALTGLATHEQDDDGAGANERPPQIPDPTPAEQKCIDAVCKHLKPPAGMIVDPLAVGRALWAVKGSYPSDIGAAAKAAKWLIDKKRNVFIAAESEELDLLAETIDGMTDGQKEEFATLYAIINERAKIECGAEVDRSLLAGWILEVMPTGYPNNAAERKAIIAKLTTQIIKSRLIAKAAA